MVGRGLDRHSTFACLAASLCLSRVDRQHWSSSRSQISCVLAPSATPWATISEVGQSMWKYGVDMTPLGGWTHRFWSMARMDYFNMKHMTTCPRSWWVQYWWEVWLWSGLERIGTHSAQIMSKTHCTNDTHTKKKWIHTGLVVTLVKKGHTYCHTSGWRG